MAAITVVQVRPHPGKAQEYLALVKEVNQLGAKHGLSLRLFLSVLAGPNVGVYSGVFEAADLATLAIGLQNFWADPAFLPLQDRLYGANGVATLLSVSQATEIPL